ncbi:MAG TPA: MBL fold metallo-hydrolase [Pseudolabrys sp.]|nr:MBL fold metallo-hydrolase [Pseudolabrys sp.]
MSTSMALEKTLHTGPMPDELVPSRYALQVGDIDVLVVSDGVFSLSSATMATNVEAPARAAWLKDMFLPDTFDWALNAVMVRSGDQTILIDTGIGEQFPNFPKTGQLVQRLGAAGIDLASATDIILTHMHFDHIGGLLIDEVKERLRPDLRIHVSAAEAKFWEAPDFSRTAMPPNMTDLIRKAAKRFMSEYKSQLRLFDTEQQVAPGVVVSRTGGHTPGHSVVRLKSRGEALMFAGDAIFPVSFEHPDWHNGFEHDPEEATRVRTRLMRELAESGSLMVATHMPFPSVGHVASAGDVFRWVPAFWDY